MLLGGTAAADGEYLFGVVPQYSPQQSALRWQPLLDFLGGVTDANLRFATASQISGFTERVLSGTYDFIYVDPLMYLQAHKTMGYRALARDEAVSHGLLVVRNDGPHSLAAIAGRSIAFPAPASLGATLLVRAELQRADINYGLAYLGSHESVYRAVIAGQYIAGGGVIGTLAQLPAPLRAQLRVLHRTPPFTGHLIAVHPRVPAPIAARVRQELLRLHASPTTQPLLEQLRFRRLVPVTAGDLAGIDRIPFPRPARALSFHVIPRLPQADTQQYMLPLTAYVRQRLEIDLSLKTYDSLEQFERAIAGENGPALINANPTQALPLIARGYQVLVQQLPLDTNQGMRAIVLVRQNSRYRTLADLRGQRIAFGGGAGAFFASIVPRVMLKRAGLHSQYQAVSAPGPVTQVLQQLANGSVEAAGVATPALQNRKLRELYIDGRLRVLARSERLPGLPWLVSPQVDAPTRDALRHLLLQFGKDAPGHAALAATGTERLAIADNAAYTAVQRYLDELTAP